MCPNLIRISSAVIFGDLTIKRLEDFTEQQTRTPKAL